MTALPCFRWTPRTACCRASPATRQPVGVVPLRARQHAVARESGTTASSEASSTPVSRNMEVATATATLFLASEASALADDLVAYNASNGEEFLKNAAGIGYIMLVALFLFRVLRRRAARARSQKVSEPQQPNDESFFTKLRLKAVPQQLDREPTALDAFLGAAQAGLLGFGLFIFSSKVTALISIQDLPDGYTARQISVTVRTILQGLLWLATFIFCLNSVGLLGLSVQMLLFPESLKKDEEERARMLASRPQLPKVYRNSSPEELKRAFEAAERMGKESAVVKADASSSTKASSSSDSPII